MFRTFNSNWLIEEETELASRFVRVRAVTLQIIPPEEKPKVQKRQEKNIKSSPLSQYI